MKKHHIGKFSDSRIFPFILFGMYFSLIFFLFRKQYISNEVPVSGDAIQYYATRLFSKICLRNGELPLWNSLLENGVPFMEDLNCFLYLPQLILMWLPLKLYIYSYYAFHMALGSVFTFLYLKKIECNKYVSLAVSTIYFFSVHLGGLRKNHIVIIAAVVYLPVILYFAEIYLRNQKKRFLILMTCVMALQFYTGMVQHVLYTDIIVAFYILINWLKRRENLNRMITDAVIGLFSYVVFISAQLIPVLNLLNYYKSIGTSETDWGVYASYSLNPVKFIMALVPQFFGEFEYRQAFGENHSSEIDIEIFLGITVIFVICFFIRRYIKKEFYVLLSFWIIFITIIFAVNPHIPFLGTLLYHIPVIGGFRACSRILFITIFFLYTILAVGLSRLQTADETSNLIRFGVHLIIRILLLCFVGSLIGYFILQLIQKQVTKELLIELYFRLKPTCIGVSCFSILIFLLMFVSKTQYRKYISGVLTAGILIITVFETFPYYTLTNETSVSQLFDDTESERMVVDSAGNEKVMVAASYIGGGYRSMIEFNTNILKNISAINAYIAFNNPNVFKLLTNEAWIKPSYNYSGLMTGFYEIKNILGTRNDILSMLGVKYIIDQENIFGQIQNVISNKNETEKIIFEDDNVIPLVGEEDVPAIYQREVELEKDSYYKISFICESDYDCQESFFVDLFNEEGYDNQNQNIFYQVERNRKNYSAIINTEEIVGEKVYLRIVSFIPHEISISNILVEKMKTDVADALYNCVADEENLAVYENLNVKDILYVPKRIKVVADKEEVFRNLYNYDFSDTAYIEGNMEEFDTGACEINEINKKYNSIEADICAKAASYIVFSQNYFPGWNVYIDGKKVRLDIVNGVLQGVYVPKGKHTVFFKYEPVAMFIGFSITAVGIFMYIMLLILARFSKNFARHF